MQFGADRNERENMRRICWSASSASACRLSVSAQHTALAVPVGFCDDWFSSLVAALPTPRNRQNRKGLLNGSRKNSIPGQIRRRTWYFLTQPEFNRIKNIDRRCFFVYVFASQTDEPKPKDTECLCIWVLKKTIKRIIILAMIRWSQRCDRMRNIWT